MHFVSFIAQKARGQDFVIIQTLPMDGEDVQFNPGDGVATCRHGLSFLYADIAGRGAVTPLPHSDHDLGRGRDPRVGRPQRFGRPTTNCATTVIANKTCTFADGGVVI
ncbi:hypothetical protein [Haematobacter missouriensis]|uniref:hypothetical protein n=1 Tax=Haematobacter missouriensis TaxID=366616 RepID=UPI00117B06FB|nr:hypothetical protein [Haematobacter missouriensis]